MSEIKNPAVLAVECLPSLEVAQHNAITRAERFQGLLALRQYARYLSRSEDETFFDALLDAHIEFFRVRCTEGGGVS